MNAYAERIIRALFALICGGLVGVLVVQPF